MTERRDVAAQDKAYGLGTKVRTLASRHWIKVLAGSAATVDIVTQLNTSHSAAAVGQAIGIGLTIIPDRLKATQRRRALMDADEVLGSRSTKRFTVSPVNEGAAVLEANLGITYPEGRRPQQVELLGKNRFIALPSQRKEALLRTSRAIYDNEYNIVFDRNGELRDLMVANMKAYIDTTNPEFIQLEQEYDRAFIALGEGKATPEFDAEKYAVLKIFRDGFANLTAIRTINDGFDGFGKSPEDSAVYTPEQEQLLQEKSFVDLSEYIDALKNQFHTKSKLFKRRRHEIFSEDAHFLSLMFTAKIINYLHANQIPMSQIIQRMVENPPTTVAELAYPLAYILDNQDLFTGENE